MSIAMPEVYSIEIHLMGDQSTLYVTESYSDDVPEHLLDNTIKLYETWNIKNMVVTKLDSRSLKLEFTGLDTQIIDALIAEFQALKQAYYSSGLTKITTSSPYYGNAIY
jgi:hypothetical protein